MFKLDLEPLAPRLLQNREMHIEYLKYAQEQADILQGIVEQAKAKQPLDTELDFACCLDCSLVFGRRMFETYDRESLSAHELYAKADIGIFVGYAPTKKAFRIYNKRTQKIIETIHVTFDGLTVMASEQFSSGSGLQCMTPATSSSRLVPNLVSQKPCFEESPRIPIFRNDPLNESPHEELISQGSSSNVRQPHTPFEHNGKWTKNHPIANVIGDPSRSVFTRKQLQTDAMWCYFDAFLISVKPKNFKQAMTEPL
ncbi:hypothetical protein Tco_1387431 [Tanacetum coccineum]